MTELHSPYLISLQDLHGCLLSSPEAACSAPPHNCAASAASTPASPPLTIRYVHITLTGQLVDVKGRTAKLCWVNTSSRLKLTPDALFLKNAPDGDIPFFPEDSASLCSPANVPSEIHFIYRISSPAPRGSAGSTALPYDGEVKRIRGHPATLRRLYVDGVRVT